MRRMIKYRHERMRERSTFLGGIMYLDGIEWLIVIVGEGQGIYIYQINVHGVNLGKVPPTFLESPQWNVPLYVLSLESDPTYIENKQSF